MKYPHNMLSNRLKFRIFSNFKGVNLCYNYQILGNFPLNPPIPSPTIIKFPPNTTIPYPTFIDLIGNIHPIWLFHTLRLLGSLEYLINVGVRLLIFWQFSSYYVLIPYPTFINSGRNVYPIRLFHHQHLMNV